MKKYEEPTMKFHQLKTASIIATSPGYVKEEQTFTGSSDPEDDTPNTQKFGTSSAWE